MLIYAQVSSFAYRALDICVPQLMIFKQQVAQFKNACTLRTIESPLVPATHVCQNNRKRSQESVRAYPLLHGR
jgi:hypothetical protein